MDLDRQAIERKDFPIGRRGYDPAAVDAHLRALAVEFDELQRAASSGGPDVSLASAAGSHVHSILEAAEAAAAEIERHALEAARQVRVAADSDAERTREDALEKARAHVAAVARATATLQERVSGMDAEVGALLDSLRAGAVRLAGDLAAVEGNMAELYDAAAGQTTAGAGHGRVEEPSVAQPASEDQPSGAIAASRENAEPAREDHHDAADASAPAAVAPQSGDLDGARLIALNMALNGDSRADTERYLAENFKLPDRGKLVEEVYAAIEG